MVQENIFIIIIDTGKVMISVTHVTRKLSPEKTLRARAEGSKRGKVAGQTALEAGRAGGKATDHRKKARGSGPDDESFFRPGGRGIEEAAGEQGMLFASQEKADPVKF